jgi:predicted HTH domain antitoxin
MLKASVQTLQNSDRTAAETLAMLTKSIRLTEEEAAALREYLELTGEIEAVALKQAALRGIREMRLAEAIRAYVEEHDSDRAARIAGLPRAEFLHVLGEKGIHVLDGPSHLGTELETLARRFNDKRLAVAARDLAITE